MPTDGEGNTAQDAAIAREILDAAQQQQCNWDQAAIANQQSSNEEMVCAKTKLRNMCAPHLAAQSLRAEGERRANEATTPTQAGEFEGHTPGPWTCSDLTGRVWAGSGKWTVGHVCLGGFETNEHQANARLITAAPRLLRERDEARADLAKLEAAHKDLKIDRDQACFDRDNAQDNAIILVSLAKALHDKKAAFHAVDAPGFDERKTEAELYQAISKLVEYAKRTQLKVWPLVEHRASYIRARISEQGGSS